MKEVHHGDITLEWRYQSLARCIFQKGHVSVGDTGFGPEVCRACIVLDQASYRMLAPRSEDFLKLLCVLFRAFIVDFSTSV